MKTLKIFLNNNDKIAELFTFNRIDFDMINNKLLLKIKCNDFRGLSCDWFSSYLAMISECDKIASVSSSGDLNMYVLFLEFISKYLIYHFMVC